MFQHYRQFVRNCPAETVGKKCSGVPCASVHNGGRPCRGRLYDAVLDWEHSLPENDLLMSEWHSRLVTHLQEQCEVCWTSNSLKC